MLPTARRRPILPADLDRWFGDSRPVLYYADFGRRAVGLSPSANTIDHRREDPKVPARIDPRLQWEDERDQCLAVTAAQAMGGEVLPGAQSAVRARLGRFLASTPPNAMEASLRCITWLELARFFITVGWFSDDDLKQLSSKLISLGAFIERRLYEVPLGGNHYLAHAVGLLYLGRLLPGAPGASRWSTRAEDVLARETLRQFRVDGGNYEQSTAYHLLSLELISGATLLLRGQGADWTPEVNERLHSAARFAAALARPDGTIPLLGDDDSGRLHQWGRDPAVREICAKAAILFDDPDLAYAAGGATRALDWICGETAGKSLGRLSLQSRQEGSSHHFAKTGLHVLEDGPRCHASLWSRIPAPPVLLAHAHADHNSVEVWAAGKAVLRDPGTGLYIGDPELRNRLRSTGAHSTISVDGLEVNEFEPADIFFMPPVTRGRTHLSLSDPAFSVVTTSHNGFERLDGNPTHHRTVALDRRLRRVTIVDHLCAHDGERTPRLVQAWWHWTADPTVAQRFDSAGVAQHRFKVAGVAVNLWLPQDADLTLAEPFPWSPHYGTIEVGRRSAVRWHGIPPFRMVLEVAY